MQDNNADNLKVNKAQKKTFLFATLILVISSLVVFTGYYYHKQKIEDKDNVSNTLQSATQPITEESVFGDIIGEDVKKQAFIKQYNEYGIGSQGVPYVFQSFDKSNMSVSLKSNIDSDLETYSLSNDFIIICVKFDPVKHHLYYNDSDDTKALIAEKSSNVSLEKKTNLLENYDAGDGVGVTFDVEGGVSKNIIKKLLIMNSDPWSCYGELE